MVKLCYYAHIGNLEMVKELIESHSVGVNEVDYTDRTALHAAAAAGHPEIVQYLVEHGADRTIQDSWGITPVGKYEHSNTFYTILLWKDPIEVRLKWEQKIIVVLLLLQLSKKLSSFFITMCP